MNKTNKGVLNVNQLMSVYGWSLSRPTNSKIIVTCTDGSGVILSKDNKNNSIAEAFFYQMMDDFLTGEQR